MSPNVLGHKIGYQTHLCACISKDLNAPSGLQYHLRLSQPNLLQDRGVSLTQDYIHSFDTLMAESEQMRKLSENQVYFAVEHVEHSLGQKKLDSEKSSRGQKQGMMLPSSSATSASACRWNRHVFQCDSHISWRSKLTYVWWKITSFTPFIKGIEMERLDWSRWPISCLLPARLVLLTILKHHICPCGVGGCECKYSSEISSPHVPGKWVGGGKLQKREARMFFCELFR